MFASTFRLQAAEAEHLMSGLDWGGAVADVKAAAAFLKAEGCTKVRMGARHDVNM